MKKLIALGTGLLLAFWLASFVSCAQEASEDSNSNSDNKIADTLRPAISKTIGYGYNVFGNYISPKYIKTNQIIDFDVIEKEFGLINKKIGRTVYQTKIGSDLSTYQTSLSACVKAHAGVSKVFSASLETTFSRDYTKDNESSYASMHTNVEQFSCSIKNVTEVGLSKLANCLTPEFKASLEGYCTNPFKPEQIFEEYGTHVIVGGTFGGRYDYYMATSKVKTSETYKLSAKLAAEYGQATNDKKGEEAAGKDAEDKKKEEDKKSGINAGGSISTDWKSINTSDVTRKQYFTEIVGGDNTLSADLKDAESYQKWLESVEPDKNWQLIGFNEGMNYNGIVPIWELIRAYGKIMEEENKNPLTAGNSSMYTVLSYEIEDGYPEYANEQNKKFQDAYKEWMDPEKTLSSSDMYVWDVVVVKQDGKICKISENGSNLSTDGGATINYNDTVYYKIDTDMNKGGGGDYVYLYVAYCFYKNGQVTLEKPDGTKFTTTKLPLNDRLIIENNASEIAGWGFTATEKLHGWNYTRDGHSTGSWRIGYKRGTDTMIRDIIVIQNGSKGTGKGPNGDFTLYGADEYSDSKDSLKNKQGQNLNRWTTGYVDTYISYYCDNRG